jgi:hypothetical protein
MVLKAAPSASSPWHTETYMWILTAFYALMPWFDRALKNFYKHSAYYYNAVLQLARDAASYHTLYLYGVLSRVLLAIIPRFIGWITNSSIIKLMYAQNEENLVHSLP